MATIEDILERDKDTLEKEGILDYLKECYEDFQERCKMLMNGDKDINIATRKLASMIKNAILNLDVKDMPFYIGYCLHILGPKEGNGKEKGDLSDAVRKRYESLTGIRKNLEGIEKMIQKKYEDYSEIPEIPKCLLYLKKCVESEHYNISTLLNERTEKSVEDDVIELVDVKEKEISINNFDEFVNRINNSYQNIETRRWINTFFKSAIDNTDQYLSIEDPENPSIVYKIKPIDFTKACVLAELNHKNGVDKIKKYEIMLSLRKYLQTIKNNAAKKGSEKEEKELEELDKQVYSFMSKLLKDEDVFNHYFGDILQDLNLKER